jgi:hypothetical protein
VDLVVPFGSAYRPLWIGFGALAFDLLLALVITSLARGRLGYRAWRAVHWFAYACWPVALLHGLGSGSDIRGGFAFVLSLACAAAVAMAIVARLLGTEGPRSARAGALGAIAAAAAALAIWLPAGPLAPGWAARAGTPSSILATAPGKSSATRRTAPAATPAPRLSAPLSSPVTGRVRGVANPNGVADVQISLNLRRGPLGRMTLQLVGQAIAGGGISFDHGQASLGTKASPAIYRGAVSSLNGGQVNAQVARADGSRVAISVTLQIDRSTSHVAGTANLVPSAAP